MSKVLLDKNKYKSIDKYLLSSNKLIDSLLNNKSNVDRIKLTSSLYLYNSLIRLFAYTIIPPNINDMSGNQPIENMKYPALKPKGLKDTYCHNQENLW